MKDLNLKGNMNIIKGKLKEKYGQLTDNDLAVAEGEEDQLLGNLQRKLDKTKDEIVNELTSMIADQDESRNN